MNRRIGARRFGMDGERKRVADVPTTHKMTLTRRFEVPVADVWRAWTEPDLVRRWWGPAGFTAPLAEMDVVVGGRSLVCMQAPVGMGGFRHYNTWTYTLVHPHRHLEFVQHFTDEHGNPVEPSSVGMPDGTPFEVPHLLTFVDREGTTEFTVTEYGYTAPEVVELSRAGMTQCLDKLATVVGST
mgnify:CR=1 FL=1